MKRKGERKRRKGKKRKREIKREGWGDLDYNVEYLRRSYQMDRADRHIIAEDLGQKGAWKHCTHRQLAGTKGQLGLGQNQSHPLLPSP